MSLDSILLAIEQDSTEQVHQIEMLAQEKINLLRKEAQAQAEQVRGQAFQESVRPAYRERARLLHQAHLDALQVLDDARRQLLEAALREARGQLAEARASPDYPKMLRFLVEQALQALRSSLEVGENPCLLADPRDKALLESLLSSMDDPPDVEYSLDCWGGVVAKSQDGRVVVENPLEVRLERAWPELSSALAGSIEAA
jgi:vacuolar-type H+-ATPase subunit E/Vma4